MGCLRLSLFLDRSRPETYCNGRRMGKHVETVMQWSTVPLSLQTMGAANTWRYRIRRAHLTLVCSRESRIFREPPRIGSFTDTCCGTCYRRWCNVRPRHILVPAAADRHTDRDPSTHGDSTSDAQADSNPTAHGYPPAGSASPDCRPTGSGSTDGRPAGAATSRRCSPGSAADEHYSSGEWW